MLIKYDTREGDIDQLLLEKRKNLGDSSLNIIIIQLIIHNFPLIPEEKSAEGY